MRTQQTQSSGDSVSSKDTEHIPLDVGSTRPQPLTGHVPVLLQEVIHWLDVNPSDTLFDGTLGGAGHAKALVELLGNDGTFVGTDVASEAIARAKDSLATSEAKIILSHTNFKNIKEVCEQNGVESLDKVLLDLGWSSDQIAGESRGFSFMHDEPLDMRLSDADNPNALTAKEILNEWSQDSIADILYGWGGERYSRRIAKAIVEVRASEPIKSTWQLVEIIKGAVPSSYRHGRINPATRTFQALRIAVNDEIRVLEEALENIRELLAPNARLAVITFHSTEDRVVKRKFKAWKEDGIGEPLTKKPIIAGEEELEKNKRARSAKLRIFHKYAK